MLARIFWNSLRKMDASRSSDPIVDSASMNALKLSLTRVSAQYIMKASFSIGRSVFLARKGFRCQPQRHLDDDHAGCEEEHKQCGPPGRVQHQSFNYTLNRSVMRFVSPCNDPTSETLCPQVSPFSSDVSILAPWKLGLPQRLPISRQQVQTPASSGARLDRLIRESRRVGRVGNSWLSLEYTAAGLVAEGK